MLVISVSLSTASSQDLGVSDMLSPMEITVTSPMTNPPGVGGVLVKAGTPLSLKLTSC